MKTGDFLDMQLDDDDDDDDDLAFLCIMLL